jgi:hypothetical protein
LRDPGQTRPEKPVAMATLGDPRLGTPPDSQRQS